MDGVTNAMDMNLSKLQKMVKDKEAWHAAVWGRKESDITQRLNNNIPQGLHLSWRLFSVGSVIGKLHLLVYMCMCLLDMYQEW